MRTLVCSLLVVLALAGCDPFVEPTHRAYWQDPDTNLCFLQSRVEDHGNGSETLTNVPCTRKVMMQIRLRYELAAMENEE